MDSSQTKIIFEGVLLSVQARSEVWRYRIDNRSHRATGYNLFLAGKFGDEVGAFSIATGEKSFKKLGARLGDRLSGTAWTKLDPKLEYADFYRAASLKVTEKCKDPEDGSRPPCTGEPPSMEELDLRGARMLDARLWKGKCFKCVYATMANVHVTYRYDSFNRPVARHRFESFCYGPLQCPLYRMGRPRSVPSIYGAVTDDGVLDELCVESRPWDLDCGDDGGDS